MLPPRIRSRATSPGTAATAALRSPRAHASHIGPSACPRPSHSWNARYTGTFRYAVMWRRLPRSDSGVGGSTLTMSRAVISIASGSRPAAFAASRTSATERGTSSAESQLMMAPSPTSPATRSMPGRRAATWIGTGPATGRLRRKPSTESVRPENVTRSPASAARRTWTISRTRVAGRSNRPPFHASTMGCEPAPMPRQKRPGATSAMPAAHDASVAGPRVKTLAIAVPTRMPVAAPITASGEKQSTWSTSYDHASV